MTDKLIEKFIGRVKLESTHHKIVKKDIIYQLVDFFNNEYEKKEYPKSILKPLEIVLRFYKDYNENYYNMIINGLKNGRIIISDNLRKSLTDTDFNNTYIKLNGNDGDVFMLVHELAHFIDRNSKPLIIPNKYDFLAEVFPFYMEKELETWLERAGVETLISVRRNNRMYYEAKMMKAIEYQLYCETLYQETGQINVSDLSINKVKAIMKYDYDECLINYLLRYPLANILSSYLIDNNMIKTDYEFCDKCLDANLYEIIENYSRSRNRVL